MTYEEAIAYRKKFDDMSDDERDKFADNTNAEELGKVNEKLRESRKIIAQHTKSNNIEDRSSIEDREKIEERKAIAKAIANGELGTVVRRFDDRGVNNNMENRNYDPKEIRSTEEYRVAFFKTLQGSATQEQRALVTSEAGSAVIPTATFNQVVENVQKQQGLLSRVRILQIPGNVRIPVSDINTPATWHVEGAEIGDTSKAPTAITLGGFELAKLFTLSQATKSMSIAAYESYLVQELTRCTQDALNNAIFNGLGTTEPVGINGLVFTVDNSLTTAVAKVVGYDELVQGMALLSSNFRQNAAWVMNSTTYYKYIATMKDGAERPYFTDDRPLGKELIIDDFAPDNEIFFGNPNYYFLNFSHPMAIEVDASAGFSRGVTMYRSMTVVDGKPLPSGAFARITVKQV